MIKVNKNIDFDRLPKHIAFIMDGNGRWAKARGRERSYGHRHGYEKMILAIKRCADLGVQVCSIFAFSTENWNRPKDEIDEIFRLIRENLNRDTDELMQYGIKVVASGDITRFPRDLQDSLEEIIKKTVDNKRCTLNLCVNYGGRADIVRAVNALIAEKVDKVDDQSISKRLYHAELPVPDLIVRTSGEMRVSNFMLWQMAYSEFLFIKEFWPAITARTIDKCIIAYQKRKRRFGKVT